MNDYDSKADQDDEAWDWGDQPPYLAPDDVKKVRADLIINSRSLANLEKRATFEIDGLKEEQKRIGEMIAERKGRLDRERDWFDRAIDTAHRVLQEAKLVGQHYKTPYGTSKLTTPTAEYKPEVADADAFIEWADRSPGFLRVKYEVDMALLKSHLDSWDIDSQDGQPYYFFEDEDGKVVIPGIVPKKTETTWKFTPFADKATKPAPVDEDLAGAA